MKHLGGYFPKQIGGWAAGHDIRPARHAGRLIYCTAETWPDALQAVSQGPTYISPEAITGLHKVRLVQ